MIKKVVKKYSLKDHDSISDDLAYWLSKTAQERLAAVEYLREQYYGTSARLQRTVKVIQRKRG